MSKKQTLAPEAQRLFIQEGVTIAGIAGTLNIAEKTVRLWKEEGGWDEKRRNYLKGKEQFHQELFALARKLMESISAELTAGQEVNSSRARLFINILAKLDIVKGYEDMLGKLNASDDLRRAGGDIAKAVRETLLKGDE
ncbi:MAG TPA: hypothetical protein PLL10_01550 [Elusimicrobiales bacterium]|nr:hypothetical protein [Elusimicrobiales bacterium]